MKELIIKIQYDDENGYKGHGDDTDEVILHTIKTNIEMDLVDDGVIKDNWSIEIVDKILDEDKLNFIDDFLQSCEDWMHNEEGKKCSQARKFINDIKK